MDDIAETGPHQTSAVGCVSRIDDDPLAVATDPHRMLPVRIAYWAEREPERPFLTDVDGDTLTYGEFEREKARWATWLASMGVGPGSRVASMLPGSTHAVLLWLAIIGCGGWEVAVNPDLRGDFLKHVLVDSKSVLAIVRPEQAEAVRAVCPDLKVVVVERDNSPADGFDPTHEVHGVDPSEVSCVIYTSGTTGPAKGVTVSHGQLASIIGRMPRTWVGCDDVVYAPWPMAHVTGRTPVVTMADVGGHVVIRERFALSAFWRDVREYGCTSCTIGAVTPLLLAQEATSQDRDHPLRYGWFGRLGADAVEFGRRFGVIPLGTYGSTEVAFPITHLWVSDDSVDVAGWVRNGYQVRVVDDAGGDVAPGEPGELLVRPPAPHLITAGYLDRPEHTSKALRDGWFHTGDLVTRGRDGAIRFVDRMSDTIRRFSENISATALEDAIRKDPEVVDCAVLGVQSPVTGQDVLLAVIPRSLDAFNPEQLWNRLHERLPRYMMPVRIIAAEDLPRSPNSKIRKRVLADPEYLDTAWLAPR